MRQEMIEVTKSSYWRPVNIRDGVPYCPCCDEPMVQVGEDHWRCELGMQIERRLLELMGGELPASVTWD